MFLNDFIIIILLSSIPACFSYLLDYALGHPMNPEKISVSEILSFYPQWLARKVLPEEKQRVIVANLELLLNHENAEIRRDGKKQLKTTMLMEASKLFFIEKALGMCPICTNFWISQIAALILCFINPTSFNPISYFLLIPVFSHTILRKL